ncbi:MAG: hypothetical protein JW808_06510 [Victivallales bacterium]|nr:hypothetical protein [Victivallales bacterium]
MTEPVSKTKEYLSISRCWALLCLLSLIVSCGKKDPPAPPRTLPKVVVETLEALQSGDHKLALVKVERLRELAPTNVFLANLETLEENNVIIVEAQKQIDKADLQGALNIVNEGIIKHGRHADLLGASNKLALAVKSDEILQVFKSPRDSAQLLAAAAQMKEIASSYPPASPFLPLVEEKTALAGKMAKWESARAIESFCSYLDQMLDKNDPDIDVLFAVLEIADPLNETLLNYLYNLKEDQNLPLKTFCDDGLFSSDLTGGGPAVIEKVPENGKTKDSPETEKEPDKKEGWWNRFTF